MALKIPLHHYGYSYGRRNFHPQNPPDLRRLKKGPIYLRSFMQEFSYVVLPPKGEDVKLSQYLYTLFHKQLQIPTHRIEKHFPNNRWQNIWKNLNKKFLDTSVYSVWYNVIHDIIPTNERLHNIKRQTSNKCHICGEIDTTEHRIVTCNGYREFGND